MNIPKEIWLYVIEKKENNLVCSYQWGVSEISDGHTLRYISEEHHNEIVADLKAQIEKLSKKKNVDLKTSYQLCVDHWLKVLHPDFTFGASHGTKMKSIIKKLEQSIKKNGNEANEQSIYNAFVILCDKLPEWYKNKDLGVIDSKFNEIVSEIKNGTTATKIDQHRVAAEDALRLLTNK